MNSGYVSDFNFLKVKMDLSAFPSASTVSSKIISNQQNLYFDNELIFFTKVSILICFLIF